MQLHHDIAFRHSSVIAVACAAAIAFSLAMPERLCGGTGTTGVICASGERDADCDTTPGSGGGICDIAPADTDGDGVTDACDNCPGAANSEQIDSNEDGIGDACIASSTMPVGWDPPLSNGAATYDSGEIVLSQTEPQEVLSHAWLCFYYWTNPSLPCVSLGQAYARSFDLSEDCRTRHSEFSVDTVRFAGVNIPGNMDCDCCHICEPPGNCIGGPAADYTVYVTVYRDLNGGAPYAIDGPDADLVPMHDQPVPVVIPRNEPLSIISVAMPPGIVVPADSRMVVEVWGPSRAFEHGGDGGIFAIGINVGATQTESAFWSSACLANTETFYELGQPLVMTVTGHVASEGKSDVKVTFTAPEPNVYPLPPDGKSWGYLKAYDWTGGFMDEITWSFGDGDRLGCTLTPDGRFTAGQKIGDVEVKGCCGPACFRKTVKISCGGGGCETGDCQQAGSGTFELDSISMTFNLGKAGRSRSAGTLTVKADEPSDSLFTPASLDVGIVNESVEVIRDAQTGYLRQVYNPAEALVDIVENGTAGYSLNFYRPSTLGPISGGYYTLPGDPTPFTRYVVSKRDGDINKLRVTKHVDFAETLTPTHTYDYTYAAGVWSLATSDAAGNAARLESLEKLGSGSPRQETTTVYTVNEQQQTLTHTEQRTYATFDCGGTSTEQMTERIVDPGGANLTTNWTYYGPGDGAGKCGQIKSVAHPDGSWMVYDYDPLTGLKTIENRSWLDDDMPASADDATHGRRTVYDYTPIAESGDSNDPEHTSSPRTVIEYVHGTVVAQIFHVYDTQTGDNRGVEILEQDADPATGSGYDDPENPTTTTTYYAVDDTNEAARGRVYTIEYPDGRLDTYDYETGSYNKVTHVFEAGTGAMQTTVTHGTTASPDGVGLKTTKEVTVTGDLGPVWLEEIFVCVSPGTFESLGVTRHEYDDKGRQTKTVYPNDTYRTMEPSGCCGLPGVETEIDGSITESYPDAMGHIWKQIRKGSTGRSDIEIIYELDAMGRQLNRVTSAGGLSRITSLTYDLAGRVMSETDESGLLVTHYDYSNTGEGGRRTTIARPGHTLDSPTEISDYYLDGRLKRVWGRGIVEANYEYGIDVDGSQWTVVYAGPHNPPEAPSPRWKKTVTDALGRIIREVRPPYVESGSSPPDQVTTYEYYTDNQENHGIGRLHRVTPPGGLGATITWYDSPGEAYLTALDADGGGILVKESNDRLHERQTSYEKDDDGYWWRKTVQSVYPVANAATKVDLSQTLEQLTGFAGGVFEHSRHVQFLEVGGITYSVETAATSVLDRNAKTVTRMTVYPDATNAEQTITINGLLRFSTTKTGVTTEYNYDALERQETVTVPNTGTTTTFYVTANDVSRGKLKGRIDYIQDQDGRKTWYEYNTMTGQTVAVINSATKEQRFEYTDRGELLHAWGYATYPIEYGYDDYGQRVTMRTYRDPSNTYTWTGTTWPDPIPADSQLTTWTWDQATGLLKAKTDAATRSAIYEYYPDGRLKKRTWARGAETTYEYYDNGTMRTGELRTVFYSDTNTHPLLYEYNRRGQLGTVWDELGDYDWSTQTFGPTPGRQFAYSETGQLKSEWVHYQGLYDRYVVRVHEADGTGRLNGISVGSTPYPPGEYNLTYGYDSATGHLNQVTGPGLPAGGARYSYVAESDQMDRVDYMPADPDPALAWADFTYEFEAGEPTSRTLIRSVENGYLNSLPHLASNYSYLNDNLNRRVFVTRSGEGFAPISGYDAIRDDFTYNDRSELTTSTSLNWLLPDTPGPYLNPARFGYTYDHIGNRQTSNVDVSTTTYAINNSLNQYNATTNPNTSLYYDEDGNLVDDGVFEYQYDGENRLIWIGRKDNWMDSLYLWYDYLGRRIIRVSTVWDSSLHTPVSDFLYFIYDGSNAVEVVDTGAYQNYKLRTQYAWGLDLSGSLQGAGGIGGLLAALETNQTSSTTADDKSYWYFYDANGNVGQTLDATDPNNITLAARYEYDPYGNTITSVGPYAGNSVSSLAGPAGANRFRFSTKWLDSELAIGGQYGQGGGVFGRTGLHYYGHRYYSPTLGRWINRDQIGEKGGPNLYGFVHQDAVNKYDPDGRYTDSLGISSPVEIVPVSLKELAQNQLGPGIALNLMGFDLTDAGTASGNVAVGCSTKGGTTVCMLMSGVRFKCPFCCSEKVVQKVTQKRVLVKETAPGVGLLAPDEITTTVLVETFGLEYGTGLSIEIDKRAVIDKYVGQGPRQFWTVLEFETCCGKVEGRNDRNDAFHVYPGTAQYTCNGPVNKQTYSVITRSDGSLDADIDGTSARFPMLAR